ncbi:unnamed protein product, partial [Trichobilharzia regenti]
SKRRIRPLSSFFQPSLTKVSEEGSSISSTDSGSDSLPSDTQHPIKDNNNNSSKDFKELQDLFPSLSVSIYDYKRRHESPPDRQSKSSNMAFEISPSQNLLSSLETSKVNDNHHCGDTGDSISNQQYDEELIKSLEVTTHNLNANNYYENNNDENNRDVTDGTTAGDHVISNKCDNDATEGDKSSRAVSHCSLKIPIESYEKEKTFSEQTLFAGQFIHIAVQSHLYITILCVCVYMRFVKFR